MNEKLARLEFLLINEEGLIKQELGKNEVNKMNHKALKGKRKFQAVHFAKL